METIKLFVAVKACIINDNNEVLLVRESNKYQDGTNIAKYDVPGGRIEVYETLSDALGREVLEETGLSVKSYELFDIHDTFNKKDKETWHIVRLFYKVACKEGPIILSKDHDAFDWVNVGLLKEFPGVIENLIPTFKKLENII